MSTSPESAPTVASPKKRNPVERVFVWGAILVLLALAAIEFVAQWGHGKTLAELEQIQEENQKSGGEKPLLRKDFGAVLAGFPRQRLDKDGAIVHLSWASVFKPYHVKVTFASAEPQGMMLDVMTPTADDNQPPLLVKAEADGPDVNLTPMAPLGPGNGPGMGGGGGGGRGTGGGGGGGGGGRGPRGMLGELNRQEVKVELKLTPAQETSLEDFAKALPRPDFAAMRDMPPAEAAKAREEATRSTEDGIKKILTPEQYSRALQLTWRTGGGMSLMRSDVSEQLKITDEQKSKLTALADERRTAMQALGMGASPEARATANSEWNEKFLALLTAEQKAAWETMLGAAAPTAAAAAKAG